jgi:hypothetical protein
LIVLSVIVYVLRQNCRAAGWRWDTKIENLNNNLAFKQIEECDFGVEYYQTLFKLKITGEDKFFVEDRAFKYIKSLCTQISIRLPSNLNYFKNFKGFSSECCLTQLQEKCIDLPFLKEFYKGNKLGLFETQWCKLRDYEWYQNFGEAINNVNNFWCIVYNFQDAGESYPFRGIAFFVLTLLTMPTSNAVVEQAFSVMNAVKTKVRNKMGFDLLDALIRMRLYLYGRNTCCHNLRIKKEMIENVKSSFVYGSGKSAAVSTEITDETELNEIFSFVCIHKIHM